MEKVTRLDMASIKSTPKFMLIRGYGMGKGIHIFRPRVRARSGVIINLDIDDVGDHSSSLVTSLT